MQKKIEFLGWPLKEPTYYDVFRYLMEKWNEYVHPIPLVGHNWEVGIIILGKPNKTDGLLNRCSVIDGLKSYDEAIRAGVEFIVEKHAYAKREIEKRMFKPGFNEWMKENRMDLEREGFDFD